MSEDATTSGPDSTDQGQGASAPDAASAAAPEGQGTGQPKGGDGGTPKNGTGTEEIIFDPAEYDRLRNDLPEALRNQIDAMRKNMVSDYTKKTMAIANDRKKIEAYDSFQKDPKATIERFAQQLGYNLTPAQKAAVAQSAEGNGWNPQAGDPESWDQVVGYLMNQITDNLRQQMAPVYQEFQQIKKNSIDQQLAEIDPSWHQYEDAMMSNLKAHPTLANDPGMLYRISVPPEVLESRATQRAIAKMEAKTKSSQIGGASSTTKKSDGQQIPAKPRTFEEAIALAKKTLAEQGIAGPS